MAVVFNKKEDTVIITINSMEEFLTMKRNLLKLIKTSSAHSGLVDPEPYYWVSLLLENMEPSINPFSLEVENIIEKGVVNEK